MRLAAATFLILALAGCTNEATLRESRKLHDAAELQAHYEEALAAPGFAISPARSIFERPICATRRRARRSRRIGPLPRRSRRPCMIGRGSGKRISSISAPF